jgi:hypothetical protein
MRLPIPRRGRAALVGVILVLAFTSAGVFAGVVAPPDSEPAPAADALTPSSKLPDAMESALPVPGANDPQAFWFPGSDATADSISSVPIRSGDAGASEPGTQEHPLIPLPGPAWTGMAGLLGLGAMKVVGKFRRWLA